MSMLFLNQNFLKTTTQITVDSANTATIENLFDRDTKTLWETVGFNGGTNTVLTISFSSSVVINKFFMQNHNISIFFLFFNGVTGNTLSVIATNTTDNNYVSFATTTVSSFSVQIQDTFATGSEYKVGELFVGSTLLDFERNPTAADYKPLTARKQVVHKMPNGGVTQFIVDDKFKGQIKWKFLTNSFTAQLQDIYDTGTAFYFVPFPTDTTFTNETIWDGRAIEVAWTNNFDFRHSSSNKDAGQGGKIIIEETA